MPPNLHVFAPRVSKIKSSLNLDPRVMREFPDGSRCVESIVYGTAAWTDAQRITIKYPDETLHPFFLKSGDGEKGKNMMEAEYLGMKDIHKFMPDFAPRPWTWGKYDLTDTYFFFMEFLDLTQDSMPEVDEFCSRLAELHQKSVSPTGQFGFHRSTFQGPIEMTNTWDADWSRFCARLLNDLFLREIGQNGSWAEMEKAWDVFQIKTLPQVLGPLQAEGRSLKPCLIHGDLWEENAAINVLSSQSVVFDPTVMYAHHELELGMWRGDTYRFGPPYFRHYLIENPPSEPIEQFDDRNRIYSMKVTFVRLLNYPNELDRKLLLSDVSFLNTKYGNATSDEG